MKIVCERCNKVIESDKIHRIRITASIVDQRLDDITRNKTAGFMKMFDVCADCDLAFRAFLNREEMKTIIEEVNEDVSREM